MNLSAAQKATLAADIAANTNTIGGVAINALPQTADNAVAVANWYNQTAAGPWVVWRDLPMETIQDLAVLANMTPVGNPPTTPDLTIQVWIARCVTCQGKQLNYQSLTTGRSVAPMKKTGFRAALQDCLTNIPAGASGALLSAGWAEIRDAAKFNATNAEKLFSSGTGTTATPANLGDGAEGQLSDSVIREIWVI